MVKFIQFGFFNKKLLLPFGIAFFQILINIMNIIIPEKSKNTLLEMIGTGLSEVSIALIPFFFKSLSQINSNESNNNRKSFLHHIVLFFIYVVFLTLNIFLVILTKSFNENNKSYSNTHNSGLSSFEGLELIFICLVSFILLKYKYFIHHIIFIAIFIIICFSIDILLNNLNDIYERGAIFIILNILMVLFDAIDYGYQKYMLDVLFYTYWNISLFIGILNIIFFGIAIIICLSKGKEKSLEEKNTMFMSFYSYFEEVEVGIIILKQILNFILNFFLNLLRVLTILHLTPDYILISFTISRIINVVIETKEYLCLILFPFQFIALMFYLEILELKFCGLNKNTRRNILKREKKEIRWETRYDVVELAESVSSESTNN